MKVQYLLSSQQRHAISSLAHIDGTLASDIVSDKRLVEYDINEDQIFMLDSLLNTKGFIVKDEKQWPFDGSKYYYIDDEGYILSSNWCEANNVPSCTDIERHDIGNIFKTKEEAKFACERLKVLNQLRNLADDDREWDTANDFHYYIVYDVHIDKCHVWFNNHVKSLMHGYWFKSKEAAEAAIKTIGEDKLKKYYFRVE